MSRGRLRLYLGAAPGVGKTYAMLDEGYRRRERGADVVVGIVETHDRARTIAQLRDLEIVPRRRVEHRGVLLEELDVDAVLARRPQVCLVDELAHTNAPGGRNERRWQDIEELLDAGIDVISTVNVQHLESLNDVVERITGIAQQETVPDAFVRAADQIELVDMSPEALRRRLAHGNVYPADRVDAALANYFRIGNLAALRELALLWVADRVEDTLQHYLADHGIAEAWETRERVVVALTGAPTGDQLIRRAARMAGRQHGDLIGVRVAPADGRRSGGDTSSLERQRRLLTELGGTYHEIVSDDPAAALVAIARTEHATQLVLGASRRRRGDELLHGSIARSVLRRAGDLDVHVIANEPAGRGRPARRPRRRLTTRRLVTAWVLLVVGLPALVVALRPARSDLALGTVLVVFLGAVVGLATLGGVAAGLVAAVAALLLVNWFFVPPYSTFSIGEAENGVALAVFVAVAGVVGALVDRSARSSAEVHRARAEAEALARSAASLAADPDPVGPMVQYLATAFDQRAVALLARDGPAWRVVAAAGSPLPVSPDAGTAAHPVEGGDGLDPHVLVLDGPALGSDDTRVVRTIADQLAVALAARHLGEEARRARLLADVDAVRTSLLRAVSHDLRTPLASIKAYASGLRQTDVAWTEEDRAEAITAIDEAADRLDELVGNLLDASRLQAGALAVTLQSVTISDLIGPALRSTPTDGVVLDIDEDLPALRTDPVLVERALANLIANATRHQPPGRPIRIDARADAATVTIRIVDHGPGIPVHQRERLVQPFQRLDDAPGGQGTGLGLAITHGFLDAVGGSLAFDDTPGGGLTAAVTLPREVP
ncbi:MAG: ATP-binding protein [Acidimicrobiia bacterium]